MFKIVSSFICFAILLISTDTRADDNLSLKKYFHSSELPSKFYVLGGGISMANKKYEDDDGEQRSDKVFYTITHNYDSSYKSTDLDIRLDPSSGYLGELLEKTSVNKNIHTNSYDVIMAVSTPLKTFMCKNRLSFKKIEVGNKTIYKYTFTNFNMVFTDMVIQVEVLKTDTDMKISVSQIAALKGSTYEKLKTFFAVGKFEKVIKLNLLTFKNGLGGL